MKEIYLTKAQFESLVPYEKHIINAYRNSFVHVPGSEFQLIAKLYAEITGEQLTKSQMGCNTCRLNALRKLGALYTKYQDKGKPKSKAGRPKKIKEDGNTTDKA